MDDVGVGREGEALAADGEHRAVVEGGEQRVAKLGTKSRSMSCWGEPVAAAVGELDGRVVGDRHWQTGRRPDRRVRRSLALP